jgi:RNA polymerase sigma factor (sigma-70 family)
MDEVALIRFACEGNHNSFNCLVTNYQEIVYHQAYRLIGEADAAEDVAQEAFISAYYNLHTFREGSFRAWLLRIVINGCYDEMRWRRRHPTTSLVLLDEEGEEVESPAWLADPSETPEDKAERNELSHAIQHYLEALPDDFRAVVILVDILGLGYAEAAQALGKPLGTVKSRLARARMRLRDSLQGVGELLPAAFCHRKELEEVAVYHRFILPCQDLSSRRGEEV